MKLKTKHRAVFLLILCIALLSALCGVTAFADEAADNLFAYSISDDGTYVIIEGYNDILPNVKIESEIDGLPVKEIAKSAFQNNSNIYSITIPDSVEKIGEAAFRNCVNLTSVRLPSTLTEIPTECFRDCVILSSVNMPGSLTKIDSRAFYGCTMLRRLSIPASVTDIGYDAFYNCESITLDCSENEYARDYAARFNINMGFEGTTLYFVMMMALGTLVIGAVAFVLIKLAQAHIKKHPSHNPAIYIAKFFSLIGRGIRFILSKLWAFIMLIVDFIIAIIDKVQRKK